MVALAVGGGLGHDTHVLGSPPAYSIWFAGMQRGTVWTTSTNSADTQFKEPIKMSL